VGYGAAIAHAAAGNEDHAVRAVGKATNSTVTVAGGAAGAAGGPAGAAAGVVVGGAVGHLAERACNDMIPEDTQSSLGGLGGKVKSFAKKF